MINMNKLNIFSTYVSQVLVLSVTNVQLGTATCFFCRIDNKIFLVTNKHVVSGEAIDGSGSPFPSKPVKITVKIWLHQQKKIIVYLWILLIFILICMKIWKI